LRVSRQIRLSLKSALASRPAAQDESLWGGADAAGLYFPAYLRGGIEKLEIKNWPDGQFGLSDPPQVMTRRHPISSLGGQA